MGRIGIMWVLGCIMSILSVSVGAKEIHIMANQMPLQTLVDSIARVDDIPIIGTQSLEGIISMEIHEPNGRQAIQQLGKHVGFLVKEEGKTLIVEGSKEKDKENHHIYRVKARFQRPEELAEMIGTIVPQERVRPLLHTNEVIYYGTVKESIEVTKLLEEETVSPRQVHLEVAVLAMERGFTKELGIQWSFPGIERSGASDSRNDNSNVYMGFIPKGTHYSVLARPDMAAKEGGSGIAIIARPSIVAMNGEEANVLIGERVPVAVESIQNGVSRTSIEYEEAGIRLRCKPYVVENNMIDTIIEAEVSNPTLVPEMKAYRITTRQAKTRVRLHDGDTLIIGGLMDKRTMKQWQKVPFLGDIPLLGKLFRHSRKTKDSVELYILVKAKVLLS